MKHDKPISGRVGCYRVNTVSNARAWLVTLGLMAFSLGFISQSKAQTAQPKIIQIEPGLGSSGAPIDTKITLHFDQAVDVGSGAFAIQGDRYVTYSIGLPKTGVTSVVITPTDHLAYGTKYRVYVNQDRITAAGKPGVRLAPPYEFHFYTEYLTAPSFFQHPSNRIIAKGANTVLSTSVLGTRPMTLQWYLGESGDTTRPVGTNNQLLYVNGLNVTTRFWVRATNSAGSADSNTATVFVGPLPSVIATGPLDEAVEIEPGRTVSVEFNEAVTLTANAVAIKRTSTNGSVPFRGLPASGVTSISLTPENGFEYNTGYTVTLLKAEVTDADGNPMLDDFSFNFTTVVPVPPAFTSPPSRFVTDGDTVSLTVQLTAGTAPVTYEWFAGPLGDTTTLLRSEGPTLATSDTFSTGPLSAPQTLTSWLRVTSDAGDSTDSSLTTLTVTAKPFVVGSAPAPNTTAVFPDNAITLHFSELVSLSSDAVVIVSPSGPVSFSGLPAGPVSSLVLTPESDLAYGATYTVVVDRLKVRDASDHPMDENHAFTFTTLIPAQVSAQPQSQTGPVGGTFTFDVTAVGDGPLHYDWLFNGASLGLPSSPVLTLENVQPVQSGDYSVVVTGPGVGNRMTSDTARLTITAPANQKPAWDHIGDLPPGQIGLNYVWKPGLKSDDPAQNVFRTATRYSATGLPRGLTFNGDTGEITGIPSAIKVTPFLLRITAHNDFGSAVLSTRLLINPLPMGTQGLFTGAVARSLLLANIPNNTNGQLGGRIDFTVAASGKVSGKITLGGMVYSFRSSVTVDPLNGTQVMMTAPIKRPRPTSLALSDLVIQLTITGTGMLANATVTDGAVTQPVTIEGWRNPWSQINRADAIAGYYTLKMDLVQPSTPYTSAEVPLGVPYFSFTLSPVTGKLRLTGRLSDNSTLTMSTFAGPTGQILIYRLLYAPSTRGSLLGKLEINAMPDPTQNTIDGEVNWTRPASLSNSNRLYRDGFPGLVHLEAAGGRYFAPPKRTAANPTAEPRVLRLTEVNNLVEVLFTEAGVETALPHATINGMKGSLALNNKVAFSTDFTLNTRRATLAFAATTGAFKASISLSEFDPLRLADGSQVLINRKVTAQGMIVGDQGEGYFILNQLPMAVGETPTNTSQQSGKVIVRPAIP